jgi:hypothetical protein
MKTDIVRQKGLSAVLAGGLGRTAKKFEDYEISIDRPA